MAKSRHINPSVSRILALRGASFHSAVRMPETVAVMIMKLWKSPHPTETPSAPRTPLPCRRERRLHPQHRHEAWPDHFNPVLLEDVPVASLQQEDAIRQFGATYRAIGQTAYRRADRRVADEDRRCASCWPKANASSTSVP